MLYKFDERFEDLKKKIGNLDNRGNSEIILKFFNKLFSEGLSKPRVLKYGFHLKRMSESIDFNTATKEDIVQFLSELEQSDFKEQTKRDYKVVLRRLFFYLGKDELVKDVKTTLKKSKRKLPEILTKAEVEKMVNVAKHPRDKAIIGVLYEGGLRIGELASLKLKNIEFDDDGVVIKVHGKTGERRVRIVTFASSLAQWIEMHPRHDDDGNAPLWVSLSDSSKTIAYRGFDKRIKKTAKKAGIKKRVNTHIFRHSRATHLANFLTEAQMNVYFGWVQGSDMPATYVHLSGRDVDDRILEMYDLKPKNKAKENELKPRRCPRCEYINAPVSRFCGRCGTVLDEEERLKLEMKSREVSKEFPDLSKEDANLLDDMKKFRDMLEMFEKHPELFKKMRAMVEQV
jgi:integrase/recombinase XerD